MPNPTQPTKTDHSRRSYLKGAGVALSALAFTGTASAGSTDYDQVVDIVDAGADPTGSEPIDDVLDQYNQDGTRIEFPDGRYLINKLSLYKRHDFALVATGDATLVPGPDFDRELWIGGGFVRNLRFEGFTLDNSAPDTAPRIGFGAWDGLVVRDIHKKGHHDGNVTAFSVSAWDSSGEVLVENLRMPDGGEPETAVAVYVNTNGTVTFRNCHVEGFGNNGIYASDSNGPVQVEGGTFKNNDISQVRLGSAGSYVRDADIVVEDPPAEHDSSRGVRVSDGTGPVTIDNCDIRMVSGKGMGGVVGAWDGGNFNLTNSRIYVGEDYKAVDSDDTEGGHAIFVDEASGIDDPGANRIENTSITGAGAYRSAVCFHRDDNVVRNVCVHQTGTERNGVALGKGSANNTLEDCNVNVTGRVVVANDGDIDVRNVTESDTCPFPAGMENAGEEPLLPFDEAPVPGDASRRTYAVAGTGDDAPVADVYLGFGTQDDQMASLEVIPRLLAEFAASGDVTVRYRPYGLYGDRDEYLATMLQGVWDLEPGHFWEVFGWAYRNHSDYALDDWQDGCDFLEDAGVRNYAKIPAVALGGDYDGTLDDTVDFANQLDYEGWSEVPAAYPCLTMNGDLTWLARTNRDERDDLVDWIAQRL